MPVVTAPAPVAKKAALKPASAAAAPAKVVAGPKAKVAAAPAPATKAPKAEKPPKEPKPAKERLSASEEELQAAIDGTLAARPKKGSADQASLGEVGENGKSKGRPCGLKTGLPILLAWAYIFQDNERLKAAGKRPKTDEQIAAYMKEVEFPGRQTAAFDNVNGCRGSYNKGGYTRGHAPKIQSSRYDEKGNEIIGRVKTASEPKEPKEPKAATAPAAPKAVAKAAKPTITTVAATVPTPKKAPVVIRKAAAPVAAAR